MPRISGGNRALLLSVVLLSVTASTGCDGRSGGERAGLGREYFDESGSWVHAGVSTRIRADIDPLRPGALGSDSTTAAYHLYLQRCGSCHTVPDPAMKSPEHWSFLVGRMQEMTRTAGLIPMSDPEADSILELLRKHGQR